MKRLLTFVVMVALFSWLCMETNQTFYLNAGDPGNPETAPAAEQEIFKVFPGSINLTRGVDYDEEGKVKKSYRTLRLQLSVRYRKDVFPLAYSHVEIREAITDNKEDLSVDKPSHFPARERPLRLLIYDFPGREKKYKFSISPKLKEPQKECNKLKLVDGSVNVKYAAKLKKVEVKPIRKWVGKKIEIAGLGNMEIHLDELTKKSVTIRYTVSTYEKLEDVLREVKFFDSDGKNIENMGHSGRGNGNHMTMEYDSSVPEDGAIIFYFYDDVRQCRVPFKIENLTLP